MHDKNRALTDGAAVVALQADAAAVILAGWLPEERRYLERVLEGRRIISADRPTADGQNLDDAEVLVLPQVRLRRRGGHHRLHPLRRVLRLRIDGDTRVFGGGRLLMTIERND